MGLGLPEAGLLPRAKQAHCSIALQSSVQTYPQVKSLHVEEMKEASLEEPLFSLLSPVFAAFHGRYLASVILGFILRRLGTPDLRVRHRT